MAKILLEIKNCRQCPHVQINSYSTDGWDRVEDWRCGQVIAKDGKSTPKLIHSCVDWWDKDLEIPNWCPLKQE